jgi:hypothetical protein
MTNDGETDLQAAGCVQVRLVIGHWDLVISKGAT